jgi:structural maintenance of chromosomes protein 6
MSTAPPTLTISSVELINFMCHSHLLINFQKPMTVISGRNGSGKSAVMVALGLALGQNAHSLERGNNMRELIKGRESICVIRVTLNNLKRFRYSFFRDTIIVERRITSSTVSMNIMNERRKVWSTRKDDLEDMLEYLSLGFSNPLNFLTQEHSKKFLNVSQSETLYKLFLKATDIAETCRLNEESMNDVEVMKSKIENCARELDGLNESIREVSASLDVLHNRKALEQQLQHLHREAEWSKLEQSRKKAGEILDEMVAMQKELETGDRQRDGLRARVDELTRLLRDVQSEDAERKRARSQRLGEISQLKTDLSLRNREIENDVEEYAETRNFKEKILAEYESQGEAFEDRIPLLRAEERKLMDDIEMHKKRLNHLLEKRIRAEEESRAEEERINEYNSKTFRLRKQIEYLSKSDEKTFFHPRLPQILAEVSRTKFSESIIGPIGHHVKLKDPRWARAASIILNSALGCFIVTNKPDKLRLLEIFKRFQAAFPILMPSSSSRELIRCKTSPHYKTLMSVLEIKDPLVTNQLILLAQIERTILIEDRKEAYEIIRSRPLHVDCAYTRNGDRVKLVGGSLSDFVSRGLDRLFFENSQQRLEIVKEELKRHQEGAIECVARKALQDIMDEMRMHSGAVELAERRLASLGGEIENAEEISRAQAEVVSGESLYDEVKALDKQIGLLREKMRENESSIEALSEEERMLRNSGDSDTCDIRTSISRANRELALLDHEMDMKSSKQKQLDAAHNGLLEEYEKEKVALRKKHGEEFENPGEEGEVWKKIAQARARLEMCMDVVEEKEALRMLKKLERSKLSKERLITEYKDGINKSLEDVRQRIIKRDIVKNEIAERAAQEFSRITRERGYGGELQFDHANQRLNLRMRVHGCEEGGSKSTLSGGERSFAGVCMLFSLWPFLSCPVKVLDEFDVFMDGLNRRHVLSLFLSFFKNDFQAILITPLDTEDLITEHCDVILLDSPQRDE